MARIERNEKNAKKTIDHIIIVMFFFRAIKSKSNFVICMLRFDPRKMACINTVLFLFYSFLSIYPHLKCTFFMITACDTFRALFINAVMWKVNKLYGWQQIRIECCLKIVYRSKICSLRTYKRTTYSHTDTHIQPFVVVVLVVEARVQCATNRSSISQFQIIRSYPDKKCANSETCMILPT